MFSNFAKQMSLHGKTILLNKLHIIVVYNNTCDTNKGE